MGGKPFHFLNEKLFSNCVVGSVQVLRVVGTSKLMLLTLSWILKVSFHCRGKEVEWWIVICQ
jgi:hypothetical protein